MAGSATAAGKETAFPLYASTRFAGVAHRRAAQPCHLHQDLRQVAGGYEIAAGVAHAFIYSVASGVKEIGPVGGSFAEPAAINNKSEVAGRAILARQTQTGAFHYSQEAAWWI